MEGPEPNPTRTGAPHVRRPLSRPLLLGTRASRVLEMGRTRPGRADVANLPLTDDPAIVMALRAGNGTGAEALWDRYHAHIRRVMIRMLGVSNDIDDAVQDVFLEAVRCVHSLEDPRRLAGWLTQIAVLTARGVLRRRRRRRWLRFLAPEEIPDIGVAPVQLVEQTLRRALHVIDGLPDEERIVFCLRFIEGMEIAEVAEACRISLATVKRRLARARERFDGGARTDPLLREWLRTPEADS